MIRCIIFDMDGTIVEAPYDWPRIRAHLNTQGKTILDYLKCLDEPEKSEKWEILERYEDQATRNAVLKDGMVDFLQFVSQQGIRTALVTNNSRKNVDFLLNKFALNFDYIHSRESGLWKPSAAPFLMVLEKLEVKKTECCVIGDTDFDIRAAKASGIRNIFILTKDKAKFDTNQVEFFPSVWELKQRVKHLL